MHHIHLFIWGLWILGAIDKNDLYFGQVPPGSNPEVFATGIVSKPGTREGAASFTPDGKTFFFTRTDKNRSSIFYSSLVKSRWTNPREWEHSSETGSWEAFVSPDNRLLYFVNKHNSSDSGGHIWKSSFGNQKWGTPTLLPMPIRSTKGFWFPTASSNGNLYFGAYPDSVQNFGKSDIYIYRCEGGRITVENLGGTINTPYEEWDPYIALDESYLLFESDRPGGFGGVDIYISFKLNGKWQAPVNLGSRINSSRHEVAAKVSPDGKYIFFDRPTRDEQDIYWVSAQIIEDLSQSSRKGNPSATQKN